MKSVTKGMKMLNPTKTLSIYTQLSHCRDLLCKTCLFTALIFTPNYLFSATLQSGGIQNAKKEVVTGAIKLPQVQLSVKPQKTSQSKEQKKVDLKPLTKLSKSGSKNDTKNDTKTDAKNDTKTNDKSDGKTWTVTLDTLGAKLESTRGWKQNGTNVYVGEFTEDKSYVVLPNAVTDNVNEAFVSWCSDNKDWKDCPYPLYKSSAGKTYYPHFVPNTVRQAADAMEYGLDWKCYSHPEARKNVWSQVDRGDCNGMTKGSWWVKRDNKEYKGGAKCSITSGHYAVPGTPSDTEGNYCWCKSASSNNWILGPLQYNDKSTCLHDCAKSCAQQVLKETKEEFRSALDGKGTTYTITLQIYGGTLISATGWTQNGNVYTTQYTSETAFAIPSWVKRNNNEKFAGWCTDKELKKCSHAEYIYRGTTGNKTYYAKYVPISDKDITSVEYYPDGTCKKYIETKEVSGWEEDSSACKGMKKGTAWVKKDNKKYELTTKCSTTKGEKMKAGTPADSYGPYCWCKAQFSKSWVLADYNLGLAESTCGESYCVSRCESVTSTYKEFRDALENK